MRVAECPGFLQRPATLLLSAAVLGCGDARPEVTPPPPPPPVQEGFAFTYTPPAGSSPVASVSVAGTFNGWSTTATPMARRADGTWEARIRLSDAQYEYKFHINGAWPADMCHDRTWGSPAHQFWIDPAALACTPDGHGGQNALVAVRSGSTAAPLNFFHEPTSAAHVSSAAGRVSIRFTSYLRQVQSATIRVGAQAIPMHLQLSYRVQDVWRGTLPEGATTYSIAVQTATGAHDFGPFTVPTALFRAVPWVGSSVGYQIFPERFWNGDRTNDSATVRTDEHPFLHPSFRGAAPTLTGQWNGPVLDHHCCHQYFGGDFQGIIDRLDHLQSLGVTLVYLNPIFLAGSAHGYDTWSYLEVDPAFGDEQVLRTLVDAAHARGIRLMWDFVPNHVGVGHAAFQDAVRAGTASPYWSWFNFKVPAEQVQVGNGSHYDAWWGFGGLPELNTANPAVLEHLMAAVRKWTTFGFDGIRVDVPGDINNPVPFFSEFRRTAKEIDPEVYLVGEIWERSPAWVQGDRFDALMNYAIGQDVVERFVNGAVTAGAASQAMAQLYAEYPEASTAMQFNVVSTHDNARLLTKLGGGGLGASPGAAALARQRVASAMLYALPGTPVTFQGDECALLGTGGGREENRYPVQWGACNGEMLAHYTRLAQLRKGTGALTSPVIRMYRGEGPVLAWFRGEPGGGEVLAAFNAAPSAGSLTLPQGGWVDLVTGADVSGTLQLEAVSWRYLRRV